jgi:hypothetical protein
MQLGSMFISNCNNTLHVSDAISVRNIFQTKSTTQNACLHAANPADDPLRPQNVRSSHSIHPRNDRQQRVSDAENHLRFTISYCKGVYSNVR